MRFAALPTLEHPLIRLRSLALSDLPHWAAYLNDPVVYEHTSWNHPTRDDLARYLGNEQISEPDSQFRLAMALRANDAFVGTVGFHSVSALNRSVELTYDVAPQHWGRGFAAAASSCLVEWAHEHGQYIRVQATVLESNQRSRRTLERLGFTCEGLLRAYRMVRGTPGDFLMFAHIRHGRHDA
jgi:[ribosomal protein S5]-alanine N-acetyltransferase